jgi:PTH1 family peptidyl-tRNA hydrolase
VQLLVGLGNPGAKYEATRHNIGFRFLDMLAESEGMRFSAAPRFHAETATWESPRGRVLLVKPQTFMNNSGEAIGPLAHFYKVSTDNIFSVYDDLDLPSGKTRLKRGGGHGGHNGLKSLNTHLPDANYTRIKIGIGRPPHGEVTAWVLGKADEGDRADEARVFDALYNEILTILDGDIAKAANSIHLKLQQGAQA